MARKSRLKPYEVVAGKDVFQNVVNPGDAVAIATKSGGNAYISKGRYLGQRKPSSWYNEEFRCYIVEQDLVRRARTNAAGEEWAWYGGLYETQRAALAAAVGEHPGHYFKGGQYRYGTPEYVAADKAWHVSYKEYMKRETAWLDEHYPYKVTPYVRRSTLWSNKIIKI